MTDESEVQIVQAAGRGDLDSFGKLYVRYYGPMVAIAYAVLTDRHLAEDATQETFARACGQLARLRHPKKFASWLTAICRNAARQMLRNSNKLRFTDEVPTLTVENPSAEIHEVVRRAIWRLSERERELIVLRYYNDLSYQQIGKVLGLSLQAVNGRLIRAKRKIAKYLERVGFTGDQL